MKKSTLILIILNIICMLAIPSVSAMEDRTVYENNGMFLRLHVRANSNSEEDQALKLEVRDAILKETTSLLENCKTKENAIEIISNNFPKLKAIAENKIASCGYSYSVSVEIKKEYFEYREYDGFFLPEDVYDSLIVKIGSGEGDNWWCVVFPAVCLSGSSEEKEEETPSQKEDIEASVEVDISAVPNEYHLADNPVPENVTYDFWIVRFFKNLFGL